MTAYDTARWAERRRPFDRMEARVVRLFLEQPDADARPVLDALRYVLSFARLTAVRNPDGVDVDLSGPLALHAKYVRELVEPMVAEADSLWAVARGLPELLQRTRRARTSVLAHLPVAPQALEDEVRTRLLAVASGGGGGAGYVYPGVYEALERTGLIPDLMAGTSIGSLMSMFRCRRRRFDAAPLVAAARQLSWSGVFRVLETENRYGLPATLRLYLQDALGSLVRVPGANREMWLSDMEIPLYVVACGISVEALKHDLGYYEHLLDDDVARKGVRGGVASGFKAISTLREFLSRRDALVQVVLGRDEGTEDFNVLDATGFSSAVPGVIHYDVLRDDPRMKHILDQLYTSVGVTRLGEGGLVSNVPARICWESVVSGSLGRRNVFVLALDCFAPSRRRIAWLPMQQAVRAANVDADRQFADLYIPFPRTLSPMNLVPTLRDALTAIRWGRDAIAPDLPFLSTMCAPIPALPAEPVTA